MSLKVDEVIAAVIRLRDSKDALKKKHTEELAPMNTQIEKLEAWLLDKLIRDGAQNFKASTGVAFQQEVSSVTAPDFGVTLEWIVENERWDMLEKRVAKTVVLEHIAETGETPPGLEIKRAVEVRVRRA